jgi:hypothetical protein
VRSPSLWCVYVSPSKQLTDFHEICYERYEIWSHVLLDYWLTNSIEVSLKVLVHQHSAVSAQFRADAADTMLSVYLNGSAPTTAGSCSLVYYRVVSVARAGKSSALNCHGGRPFPSPHRPPRLDTCTRTLIPVLSVDKDQLGGVKVGSNNLGGGNAFDPMSAAARFYWPHQ